MPLAPAIFTSKVMRMKTKSSRNDEAFGVGELHSTVRANAGCRLMLIDLVMSRVDSGKIWTDVFMLEISKSIERLPHL